VLGCLAAAAVLLAVFVGVELVTRFPMLDLALLRKPTFTGGSIAAFGISASLFSMLLYLTIYLQDVLSYTPFQTGLRLLTATGGLFVVAGIAGRLSSYVPVRWLIGPGLLIIGVGLLLMRGLTAQSQWTHLVPGLIVAGVGAGLVNPPLASTAVGVVPPRQAGMASGVNSTFRQVGIATGIALLGSLFASKVASAAADAFAKVPGIGPHAAQIKASLTNGELGKTLLSLPPQERRPVAFAARSAFTTGLNYILLVAGIIALVSAVLSLALIHTRDFINVETVPRG
jgi:predicted MFS family arabinose efflux permease